MQAIGEKKDIVKCEHCGSKKLKEKVWNWKEKGLQVNMFYCARCMVDVIPERELNIISEYMMQVY